MSGWAALCVAGALAAAGRAEAALVQADFAGGYWSMAAPAGFAESMGLPSNIISSAVQVFTNGPVQSINFGQGGVGWGASFVFDTALGDFTDVPIAGGNLQTLTASPLVSGTFNGFGPAGPAFTVTEDLTGGLLTISLGPGGMSFRVVDGDMRLSALLLTMAPGAPDPACLQCSLTAPFHLALPDGRYFIGSYMFSKGLYNVSTGGTRFADLTPLAVPEPGTWGLMLLGLTGLGVALRRRRLPKASANNGSCGLR